jgi:hypothetical protein
MIQRDPKVNSLRGIAVAPLRVHPSLDPSSIYACSEDTEDNFCSTLLLQLSPSGDVHVQYLMNRSNGHPDICERSVSNSSNRTGCMFIT